jgi:S1-C subfamily serine protease
MSAVPGRQSRVRPAVAFVLTAALIPGALAACAPARRSAGPHRPSLEGAYKAAIATVLPSVVEINAGNLTGSGVVFDRRGDIVTNAHLIGTAKRLKVRVSAASHPMNATLVGVFAPDDLAVIRVSHGARDMKPVRWANSSSAHIGAIVLAMGSPYGLTDSVTQGIVSATGRTVTGPTISGHPPTIIVNAVQTSAPINPGNSGGALVLLSGHVLGIPTLNAHDADLGGPALGIGFAIPSNTVVDIGRQLIRFGKVTKSDRASLEIEGETHVNSTSRPDGVTVVAARPGGAAADAGIRARDVIVGVAGQATSDIAALGNTLIGYWPGDTVKVEVLREGNPRQFTVRLGNISR